MTVVGIGLDLAERSRVRRALARHGTRFVERVLHPDEVVPGSPPVDAVVARFAAKEAGMKALGTGWAQGIAFRDLEIVDPLGPRPAIRFHGAAARRADRIGAIGSRLSVTWAGDLVAALVILSGDD
jgi:holo-[acyl-carrier protein] synthase